MIRRTTLLALASVCLLAAGASPALGAYYPFGPQAFVDKSQLDGWQLCFSDLYGDNTQSLDSILAQCNGEALLLAGGPTGSSTLTVLAAAPRADVIFDTGTSNVPHDANGSGWYYNDDWSWGFAKQGDPIIRDNCDTIASPDGPPTGPNPDLRLCWHTAGGLLDGGYRAGATTELNTSSDYARYIYQGTVPPPNGTPPATPGPTAQRAAALKKCKKKAKKKHWSKKQLKKCKKKAKKLPV